MKVLSLWQPWASLIALGVKSIETRSWRAPDAVVGERIAIHAAKTTAGIDSLPGDCEGNVEGGWRYGYIGDYQAAHCFRSSDEGRRGDAYLHRLEPPIRSWIQPVPIPLGAIVATARITACLPMMTHAAPGDPDVIVAHPDGTAFLALRGDRPVGAHLVENITDQVPYGDFRPERYGWLLADVEPLAEPVPFKGGQGLTREWTP